MKLVFIVILFLFSGLVNADCIPRYGKNSLSVAEFEIVSCEVAIDFIKRSEFYRPDYGKWLTEVTVKDLAIGVKPLNQNATMLLRGNTLETWHHQGNCASIPMNSSVKFDLKQSCCDAGIFLECFLGEVTVEKIEKTH